MYDGEPLVWAEGEGAHTEHCHVRHPHPRHLGDGGQGWVGAQGGSFGKEEVGAVEGEVKENALLRGFEKEKKN